MRVAISFSIISRLTGAVTLSGVGLRWPLVTLAMWFRGAVPQACSQEELLKLKAEIEV